MDRFLRSQSIAPESPEPKSATSKRQFADTGSKDDKEKIDYHDVYRELDGVIGALNSNIDRRIAANDADFMEAYRVSYRFIQSCKQITLLQLQGHMLKIQKELDRLRKKTNECEFIIKKDERVRKLEAQIAWFRDEALFLSGKIQTQNKETDRLKERCFCLEEEKSYHLEIQEKENNE